jgi:signal transduction histidine kinase
MNRIPIRARLTAWSVVAVALILTALGAFVVTRLRADLISELDRSLRAGATQIALGYQREGGAEFVDTALTVLPDPAGGRSAAQVLTRSGTIVHHVGPTTVASRSLIDAQTRERVLDGAHVAGSERVEPAAPRFRLIALPVTRKHQRQVLVVAQSLASVDHAVQRVLVLLLVGSAVVLALVAAGAWWIVRKALRPVEQMVTHTDGIDIDDLSQRIAVPPARDELGHLARTLNSMLDRLDRGVHIRQQLIADTSHELRAPLAAMRSELDVSLRLDSLDHQARAVLESAHEELVRMSRIVDNLLTLARVDEGRLELLIDTHDLLEAATSAARVHGAAARAAGVALTVEGDRLELPVDRDRLEQVIGNLIDNAIRAATPGGSVRVSTWQNEAQGGVTVTDTGAGVPSDARERIFERFTREDSARGRDGGAGLGLAISRDIVRAHEGRIHVEDNQPRGSAFVVSIPLRGSTSRSEEAHSQPTTTARESTLSRRIAR